MAGSLEDLFVEIGRALRPIAEAVTDVDAFQELAIRLGWRLAAIPGPLGTLAQPASSFLAALDAVLESDEPARLAVLVTRTVELAAALDTLRDAHFDPVLDAAGFGRELARGAIDGLLIDALGRAHPLVRAVLRLLGMIRVAPVTEDGPRHGYIRREIRWDALPRLLDGPAAALREAWGWGTATLDHQGLLGAIQDVLAAARLSAGLESMTPAWIAARTGGASGDRELALTLRLVDRALPTGTGEVLGGLRWLPVAADGAHPPGLMIAPFLSAGASVRVALDDHADLTLQTDLALQQELALIVRPDGLVVRSALDGSTRSAARVAAEIDVHDPDARRYTLLRAPGVTVEAATLVGRAGVALEGAGHDVFLELCAKDAVLSLAPGGFLGSLLPEGGLALPIPVAIGMSKQRGFYLVGGGGLETRLGGGIRIGPVTLDGATIGLSRDGDRLRLRVEAGVTAELGPLRIAARGLGVAASAGAGAGSLGSVQLSPTLPDQLAVAIESKLVIGGGVVSRRPLGAGERYAGALAVEIGQTAVAGFGVLDRDARGTSCAIVLGASFPPIPLGLGFELRGVGGLLAVHREPDYDAMRAGLREGRIDRLLFPGDLARAGEQAIANLATLFPARRGRHVIAPAVRIGWGAAQQLDAKVAIALELPEPIRIALLAAIDVALPRGAPIVHLKLDALGVVDLARRTLALDASLHDSQVAGLKLSGDAALRLGWGDSPAFLLSIGGFHPRFRAPAGFPALRRVELAAGQSTGVRLQGYLAITSNTLQLGAKVELRVEVGPGKVVGSLAFDALVTFSPITFEIELHARASLQIGSVDLISIELHFWLSGPSPWRAAGEASIKILFFRISFGFDVTFGRRVDQLPEPVSDPFLAFQAALSAATSRTVLGPSRGVRTRLPEPNADRVVLHPSSELAVKQTVVPLGATFQLFRGAAGGPWRYAITTALAGVTDLRAFEHFAPAQYFQLTEDRKLSAPSFEIYPAGLRLRPAASPASGPRTTIPLEYEIILWDGGDAGDPLDDDQLAALDAAEVVPAELIARTLRELEYVVATIETMAIAPESEAITDGATAYTAVVTAFERWRVEHPARAAELQVLARYETYDAISGEGLPRVIVTEQSRTGKNVRFYDTVDREEMELDEFIRLIEARPSKYAGLYHIRKRGTQKIPAAIPDQLLTNNLEPP